jgi:hypothetical protein
MIKTDLMKIEERIEDRMEEINHQPNEETRIKLEKELSMLEEELKRKKSLFCWREKLYQQNWKQNILKKSKCDCGAEEGEPHKTCDRHICPTCGGQLGSCNCDNDGKEPVPFIDFPTICDYCGELWPELFMDDEWEEILPEIYWGKLLCLDCWKYIKGLLTNSNQKIDNLSLEKSNDEKDDEKIKEKKEVKKEMDEEMALKPREIMGVNLDCLSSYTSYDVDELKSLLAKVREIMENFKEYSSLTKNSFAESISQTLSAILYEVEQKLVDLKMAMRESIDELWPLVSDDELWSLVSEAQST